VRFGRLRNPTQRKACGEKRAQFVMEFETYKSGDGLLRGCSLSDGAKTPMVQRRMQRLRLRRGQTTPDLDRSSRISEETETPPNSPTAVHQRRPQLTIQSVGSLAGANPTELCTRASCLCSEPALAVSGVWLLDFTAESDVTTVPPKE
jgi:hypothetical protein